MRYLSIVIPAYNEAHRIGKTLFHISNYLSTIEHDSEIIVVNDGSTDTTEHVVRRFMHAIDDMKRFKTQIIYSANKDNKGKGYALRKGMSEASGRYILFTDADNSTPITECNKLLQHVCGEYDIAIGSRSLPGSKIIKAQSVLRQSMGKIYNKVIRLILPLDFIDTQCGFKLFKREAARKLFSPARIDGFAIDVEILYIARKKNMKIIEVPVVWENHPDSRVSLVSSSLQMLRDLFRIRKFRYTI